MRLAKLVFFLSIVLLPGISIREANAQTATTISGTITDAKSQEPLFGATIYAPDESKGTATDSLGRFSLEVSELPQSLRISAAGYEEQALEVSSSPVEVALKPNAMQDVVISAIRGKKSTPITQTTLDKKDIDEQYYGQDATGLLTKTPNVIANWRSGLPMSNYSDIRLRGMEQQRINFTLNGVPLNDALDHGVFFSNFPGFMNSIQSMQVQRGVGTSTNGQASYAGSVNFESVNLKDAKPSGELSGSYGSYNTYRGSAEAKTGLMDNNMALYVKYGAMSTNGYKYHSGTKGQSFFMSGGWFKKKHTIKATAFVGRSRNELSWDPQPIELVELNARTNLTPRDDIDNNGQELYQLQYTYEANKNLSFSATGFYNEAFSDFPIFGTSYSLRNQQGGFFGVAHYEKEAFSLDAGLHLNRFWRRNFSFPAGQPNVVGYDNTPEKDEAATFVKAQYRTGNILLFADLQVRYTALRYDSVEASVLLRDFEAEESWILPNPKLGLRYFANDKLSSYLSAGLAYREPTLFDFLGSVGNVDASNIELTKANFRNFDPERVFNVEAGVEYQSKNLNVSGNLFMMEFANEILVSGALSPLGEPIRNSVSNSFRRGVELQANYKPLKDLTLEASFAYTWARIPEIFVFANPGDSVPTKFENRQPAMTPPILAQVSAEYRLPLGFFVGLSGTYRDKVYLDNQNTEYQSIAGFLIANANLGYRSDHFDLNLQVNNFLKNGDIDNLLGEQKQYIYGASSLYGAPGKYVHPLAPANAMLTARLKF